MHKLFRISTLAGLALGATALTAHAQNVKTMGVLAGVDFATLSGDDVDGADVSSRTGFIGGLYAAFPVASALAVEVDALYAMKGANFDSFHLTNSYIEIPVLLKYHFNANGGPYLLAGPAIGFSISCKEADDSISIDCSDDGVDPETAFSGVLGIGYQKGRFGLEGRYDFDFNDAFTDIAAKNSAWEILARIMLK